MVVAPATGPLLPAAAAKQGCPVSKALTGVEITVQVSLAG